MLKVRALRDAKGWSQQELALRADVRPATISDIERSGKAQIGSLVKVAEALGLHLLDIFEDDRTSPEAQDILERLNRLDEAERKALLVLLPRKPPSDK